MQHTFTHTIEQEIFPDQTVEIDLTVTYEYTPPSRGSRGSYGEPEEPDEDAEIVILSITDATGKEYAPEKIENIYPACWDHFENLEQ